MGEKMKKNLIISTIVSLGINLILFLVNLICAYTIHTLPLSQKLSGGEYMGEIGFGVLLEKIFYLSLEPESGGTTEYIRFDLMSLLVPIIIVFIITLIILTTINKRKSTK